MTRAYDGPIPVRGYDRPDHAKHTTGSFMTIALFAASRPTGTPLSVTDYQAGACNIGPAEIARRRRVGHAGTVVAIGTALAFIAIGAPPPGRLLVALPAAMAAAGYLQAWLRFCAAFGSRGVANFGQIGEVAHIEDPVDLARDRRRAWGVIAASTAIGAVAGVLVAALPI
jgi:hypothetical protein